MFIFTGHSLIGQIVQMVVSHQIIIAWYGIVKMGESSRWIEFTIFGTPKAFWARVSSFFFWATSFFSLFTCTKGIRAELGGYHNQTEIVFYLALSCSRSYTIALLESFSEPNVLEWGRNEHHYFMPFDNRFHPFSRCRIKLLWFDAVLRFALFGRLKYGP